jgi:hypothetical protein
MMSSWPEFLRAIQEVQEITLVGPLYNERHSPLMPTIYVDGGSRFRADGGWAHAGEVARSEFACVSVGDGDSGGGQLDELLPPDKDYSDLAFALRALPPSVSKITLLGFLGGRRDHELANLGEVHAFLAARPSFARADLVGAHGDRVIGFAHGVLEFEYRGEFSLLVLSGTEVSLDGQARYLLPSGSRLSPLSSLGLSNQGFGKMIAKSDDPCFIVWSKPG